MPQISLSILTITASATRMSQQYIVLVLVTYLSRFKVLYLPINTGTTYLARFRLDCQIRNDALLVPSANVPLSPID